MVDSIKVDRLILQAGIDAQKAREAMTGLAGINRAAEQVVTGFQRFSNAARGMPQSIRPTLESLARLKSQARSAAEDVADLREELLRVDAVDITVKAQQRLAARGGDLLNTTGRVTRRVGMLASGLGASELAAPLMFANDLSDVAEIIPEASKAMRALAASAQALPGVLGSVSTLAATAAGGLGATAASFAAIAAPVALVAAPVVALGLAIAELGRQVQEGRERITGFFQAEDQDMAHRIALAERGASLSSQQLDAEQAANLRQQQIMQAELAERAANVAAMQAIFDATPGQIQLGALNQALEAYNKLGQATNDLGLQYLENENVLRPLIDAREAETNAIEAARRALEDRNRTVISELDTMRQRQVEETRLIREGTSEAVAARIAGLQDENDAIRREMERLQNLGLVDTDQGQKAFQALERTLYENSISVGRLRDEVLPLVTAREAEADAAKAEKQALEDLAKQREAWAEDLIKTTEALFAAQKAEAKRQADVARQAGRDSIVKGFESRIDAAKAAERAAEQERELVDARTEAVAAVQELDAAYMADSLKALQDYQREESRLREDYNTEQRRAAEDLFADLTDLAAQRDVAGFIRRQREGERDIQRGAEDFGVEAGRRAQDFARSQAERTAEYQQERAQRQAQAQERIAQIRAEGQAQKTESERLQQELSDLRARWAEEDRTRENAERAAAAAEQIALLKTHQTQVKGELAASYRQQLTDVKNFAQGVVNLWNQVKTQVQQQTIQQRVDNAWSQIAATVNSAKRGAVTVKAGSGSRYATGVDYVPSDRWAFLHQGEEVRSAAAARQSGRNASVTFVDNRTVQVGDIASKRMVEEAIAADRREMMAGLQMAVWSSY